MAHKEMAFRPVLVAGLFTAMALAIVSCGGGGGTPPLQDAGAVSTVGPLQFQAFVPQTTYARGQQVPMYMIVTNTSDGELDVSGADCVPLVTVSHNGVVIASDNGGCIGDLGPKYVFPPHNPQVVSGSWDGHLGDGSNAPAGTYQLVIGLQAPASQVVPGAPASEMLSAPPITIRVR